MVFSFKNLLTTLILLLRLDIIPFDEVVLNRFCTKFLFLDR